MSEYYFEYSCLSCETEQYGEGHQKTTPKFLLFQDYSQGGKLCIQVVPDLPQNCAGVKYYHIENGIDAPKAFDDLLNKKAEFISKKKIEENGCFYIYETSAEKSSSRAPRLSGCGILGCVKKKEDIPDAAQCYKYWVNFGAKQEITYSITEKKNKILIDIKHPPLREDLKLLVFSKSGSKPLEKRRDKEKNVGSILLKAGVGDYLHIVCDAASTEGYDFRLFFANDEDAKYYLLVDESLETLEERAATKKGRSAASSKRNALGSSVAAPVRKHKKNDDAEKGKRVANPKKKKIKGLRYYDDIGKSLAKKCPYCGYPINLPQGYNQGKGFTICECGGALDPATELGVRPGALVDVTGNTKLQQAMQSRRHIICCGRDYRKEYTIYEEEELYKHLILPEGYMEKPSMNVATIGVRSSGKSVFLSTLLGVRAFWPEGTERGVEKEEAQAKETLHLLKSAVKKYDGKPGNDVELSRLWKLTLPNETEPEDFFELSKICGDHFEKKTKSADQFVEEGTVSKNLVDRIGIDCDSWGIAQQELIRKYWVEAGVKLPSATDREEGLKSCSLHPFGFRMGNLGYGFFYDIPGELFNLRDGDSGSLRGVRNADCLVLIINGRNQADIKDSIIEVMDNLSVAKDLKGSEEAFYNTPVAVVLTKFDRLQDVFDENCHVLRENMLYMIDRDRRGKKGKYAHSAIEKHVDCSSYEIEHYLASQGVGDFVNYMRNFTYHKYFAVSALGGEDRFVQSENAQILKFHERPLRVELPIVWLMYQMGLIKE